MRPFIKATLFLFLLTILEFVLRKGLIFQILPLPLPKNLAPLLVFSLFTLAAWFISRWFCRKDKEELEDLGISFSSSNRRDFYLGFLVGVFLWGIVSLVQSYTADFSWEFRPNISIYNILYGLLFIFIADLGTELYTRGYPLTRLKDSFGEFWAIILMVIFFGLTSYSPNIEGEFLFYTMLIPALHAIFFSIIYFKTNRLGGPVGVHTGANFITISIFDLRPEQAEQAIPPGIFQADVNIETLSLSALQLPWLSMAVLFSIVVYLWRVRK